MKYRTQLLYIILLFTFVLLIFVNANQQENITQTIIKDQLQDTSSSILVIDIDTLYAQSQIRAFYQRRFYYPIWTKFNMQKSKLQELIDIIEQSYENGFNPDDYHLVKIKELQKKIFTSHKFLSSTPTQLAKLDILLSDAFLTLMLHYYAGKIQSKRDNRDWEKFFKELHLIDYLNQSIQTNQLKKSLISLEPRYQEYQHLKKVFNQYQKKEGIYSDNSMLKEQLSTMAINMERWRWLPKTTDSLYLIINIPAYQLLLYCNDTVVMSMKTIVGKPNKSTPTFNSKITYIVLRPEWNIPTTIIKNEILPKVIKNILYLAKNNIRISKYGQDENTTISPNSIQWKSINPYHFPYQLIQSPGATNPLGEIKFMFPNQFNIYLHDTPSKNLFNREVRTLSHGCIRIEKAKELGAYLMHNDTILLSKNYKDYFQENEIKKLSSPLPIFINYWTVWSTNLSIVFYKDIYKNDASLKKAMKQKPALF